MSDKRTGKKTKAIRAVAATPSDTPVVSDLTQPAANKKKRK